MIQAPIGYRCPDCMRAEQPVEPTTVAGATTIAKPYVTYTLIVINLLVFAYQYSVGINAVAERWGMWPVGIVTGDQWYRLLTSAFLHGSFLHIAFNMYVLFALGPTLERILGHVRFTALYLLSAVGGAVASYFFSDITTVSVGASGAIFGLMGALVVAGRRLRYDVTQVLVLLGINVVIGFL
ncbi:MAG: rhomboid family intramembrane serine protease, partial [Actinomycetota bacterium]|nr:rhomboid family intramembrane serine protease [Actinomycetota bacterium]